MSNIIKYPHLFSPIRVAGQTFKNRIFAAPTGWIDLDKDGLYPPEAALYYGRKAQGGAASVALGECCVDSEYGVGYGYGVRLDGNFSGDPYSLHGLTRVAEEVSRYGAVCTTELQHAGIYGNRWRHPEGKAYGPVGGIDIDGREYFEMDEAMIEHTIETYARAAAFAKQCGVGMVLVHAGHGWLLHQFLSPKLNTRKDKWGGPDIENRARLTVAVLDAVRRAVGPAFPIEVRISGSECYEGGYDIEEGIAIARQLDGHADIIHVSAGSHEVEEVFTVTHPSMFREEGCNVKFAAEIKKHVNCHVATLGGLVDPEQMEEIIASGKADIIEVARGILADPDLPMKARAGKEDEINKCMRCLACFSNLVNTGHFRCAINPETGRELDVRYDAAPTKSKKVLVAGGGIGGMQAAITCAQRGHKVVLCEMSESLGGALKCEEDVPFKQPLSAYLASQARKVKELGVEVRLNTKVTPELADEIAPDAIVAALGASPVKPRIPGIDGANVMSAEYAYTHAGEVGDSAIILGAGLVGMELAVYLAMQGKKITIIEMLDKVNHGGNFQHMKGLQVELDRHKVDINLETKCMEIDERGIVAEHNGESRHFDAATVIYAVGQRPRSEDAYALANCAPEFYPMGDCIAPKNIMNATSQAFMIARSIGRI